MTSMATSEAERKYNISKRLLMKAQEDMKNKYRARVGCQSLEFEEAVELNNALAAHVANLEEALKTDPERFVK